MDLFSSVMHVCRKSILYILMGIKLWSLPVSILHLHVSVLWIHVLFSFMIIIDLTLRKSKHFYIPMSNSFSAILLSVLAHVTCSACLSSAISWHSSASVHSLEMISYATSSTALAIGHTFAWLMGITAVSTDVLCHFSACFVPSLSLFCWSYFFVVSTSLLSSVASKITFWTLCTPTLLVQGNICPLVLSFVFLNAVNNCIISVFISSSFLPFMDCSFSLLSFSL